MKKLISILMLGTCLSSSFSLTSFAGRPGGASAGTGGASETPGSNRKKVEIEIPGSNGKKIIIFEEADSDIDDIDSETISENPIIQYSEEVSSNKKPRINIEQKKKEHGNQKYKVPDDAKCPNCGETDTLRTRGKDSRYKGNPDPNIGIILYCENCSKDKNSSFIYGATKHIKKYSEENTSDKGPRPTINIEQKKKKYGNKKYKVPADATCPDCGKNYTLHTRGKAPNYKGNPDPNIGIRLYCENCSENKDSYFVYGTTRHKKIKSPISKPTDLEKE